MFVPVCVDDKQPAAAGKGVIEIDVAGATIRMSSPDYADWLRAVRAVRVEICSVNQFGQAKMVGVALIALP